MSGESRLMSRNPYYCIHGAPLDRRCEACATAPDPVDDAAVEADTDTIPRKYFHEVQEIADRLAAAERKDHWTAPPCSGS